MRMELYGCLKGKKYTIVLEIYDNIKLIISGRPNVL